MIDVKLPLRTAYYSLLNGHLVYGGNIIPVSDSVEKLADTSDIYVLLTQQYGTPILTQQSWNSEETMLIDIISRGTRVSKNVTDNIASQIFTLLFPNPQTNALPAQAGIYIYSARVTDDRYLVFGQTGGKNVTRRLITVTQLVTQTGSGSSFTPGTPRPAFTSPIKSADFFDATTYKNAALVGDYDLFINEGSVFLEPGVDYERLAEGGFRILIPDFDSAETDVNIYVIFQ